MTHAEATLNLAVAESYLTQYPGHPNINSAKPYLIRAALLMDRPDLAERIEQMPDQYGDRS